MRLEWIDDILAVLDTGSLGQAAEKRFLTQSAFTRRIRLIEGAIGATLFDRSRKPVVLMPGVAAMEPELRRVGAQLRRLREDLRRQADPDGRVITIACQHALSTTLSSRIVGGLSGDLKSVRLQSGNRDECLFQLLSGGAEAAIVYHVPGEASQVPTRGFESVDLGQDRLIAVAAPGVAAAGFSDLPLIAYPHDAFLGRVFEDRIVPNLPDDIQLTPRAETELTLAMMQMTLDGHGLAWLPQSLIREHLALGRLVRPDIDLPGQVLQVRMIRLSNPDAPRVDAIWEQLAQIGLS